MTECRCCDPYASLADICAECKAFHERLRAIKKMVAELEAEEDRRHLVWHEGYVVRREPRRKKSLASLTRLIRRV